MDSLTLDVVVPTYNRSKLLKRTIESLLTASVPKGLDVQILVVDNNCVDDTREIVRCLQRATPRSLRLVLEPKQGLSNARNGGIAAGTSDVIGFIDDDEEVNPDWFEVVFREFSNPDTQFIGGPYLPNWEVPAPSWLPPGYHSAIGVVPPKERSPFGPGFTGNLMGGNAVIRRHAFNLVGLYSPKLGRSAKGLLSDEDDELYGRLCAARLPGVYVPDLIIHHHIPASRLSRNYHRRWCFWRAASKGSVDRERAENTSYLFGIPRYRFGRALNGIASMPLKVLTGKLNVAFAGELAVWDLLGFVYGKRFMKLAKYYGDDIPRPPVNPQS